MGEAAHPHKQGQKHAQAWILSAALWAGTEESSPLLGQHHEMPKWPFPISSEEKAAVHQPDHADLGQSVKEDYWESHCWVQFKIWHTSWCIVHMTMLQDISSAPLLPEVAFFHQRPQPACREMLPPRSMGVAMKYLTRQAWPECVHPTERNIWAHPCWWAHQQSVCVQIIQHKVSLGSDTGWGPAFKIQYRNRMCFISLIQRFSH